MTESIVSSAHAAVTVARHPDDVERLRGIWAALPPTHPDADLDHFLSVVGAAEVESRPHVLHVPHEGHDMLVVARVVDHPFRLRVGYRTLASMVAPTLVVSFDGVLGARSARDVRHALRMVHAHAPAQAAAILFQKVDTASLLFDELQSFGRPALRLTRPSVTTWSTELSSSWDELLAQRSGKSRRQLRYDDTKLRRTYAGRLELRRLDLPEHQHRLMGDLRAVASASYQSNLAVSVLDDPLQLALLSAARSAGLLRVWMLYVDNRPVAFWWGVVRSGTLMIGSPGFLPEHAGDRVGYYTLRRMIEDACADPEISRIDYGPGDADYKRRFATHHTEVADVIVFRARPRSLALKGLVGLNEAMRVTAKRAVDQVGHTPDLRRRLRTVGARSPRA